MNCAEAEILICDLVDGTLPAAERAEVERHLVECALCAELARDAAAAVSFMERAADVEPPPELINRILFDAPWSREKRARSGWRKWMSGALSPILQPKFAMGMAMTILSLSMLWRFAPAPLKTQDLTPTKIWSGLELKASYAWGRTVKFYDNLKFVYQIQNTLRQWRQRQEEEQQPAEPDNPDADGRKLPVKSSPEPTGAAPSPNPTGGTH